jgi:hypothetical protein
MFLHTNPSQTGYTRDGQQKAGGPFLILFSQDERFQGSDRPLPTVRACVRSVRMSQFGHFMMGSAQVGPHRITLSGSYGSDGLTDDPDKYPGLWDKLLPVPNDLAEKFWNGGGHNSSGSEGPDMRQWAKDNIKALRKAGK